jgi:hypothetical protein
LNVCPEPVLASDRRLSSGGKKRWAVSTSRDQLIDDKVDFARFCFFFRTHRLSQVKSGAFRPFLNVKMIILPRQAPDNIEEGKLKKEYRFLGGRQALQPRAARSLRLCWHGGGQRVSQPERHSATLPCIPRDEQQGHAGATRRAVERDGLRGNVPWYERGQLEQGYGRDKGRRR